jgi:hypothetical protein
MVVDKKTAVRKKALVARRIRRMVYMLRAEEGAAWN